MAKTVMFIHGAFMTPLCRDKFVGFFSARGYTCLAPAWPYKDQPVEDQRRQPDPRLATLGATEIVEHYAQAIRALDEPPFLIGHSFGGLFVQMLLDRNLGAAGVAVDSAPPSGVWPFYPTTLRALFFVYRNPANARRVVPQSLGDFRYGFVNTQPPAEQQAVYERYVVPETGRLFYQGLVAPISPTMRVNFRKTDRAPLLFIAGEKDHLCPAAMNRSNAGKYAGSGARTDFKVFPDRGHWIIGQPGWEEVAAYSAGWLERLS